MNRLQSVVFATTVTLVGACGTDTNGPELDLSPLLNMDVARVAADAAAEDVALMRNPGTLSFQIGFAAPPGGDFARSRDCVFENGRFNCPAIAIGPLTIIRSFAFADANGAPQSAYDEVLTASANFRTSIQGEATGDSWSGSVLRNRDYTATGLLGSETQRTWNGTGNGEVSRSRHTDGGANRTYDMSYTTTTTNVVVPFPRTPEGWPLSGTIARQVTVMVTGGEHNGATRQRSALVTFNGTQFVPLVVNGETYTLDLGTRRIVRQ